MLDLLGDAVHRRRSGEDRIAFGDGLERDLLEPPLCVMSATWISHLSDELNHGLVCYLSKTPRVICAESAHVSQVTQQDADLFLFVVGFRIGQRLVLDDRQQLLTHTQWLTCDVQCSG